MSFDFDLFKIPRQKNCPYWYFDWLLLSLLTKIWSQWEKFKYKCQFNKIQVNIDEYLKNNPNYGFLYKP